MDAKKALETINGELLLLQSGIEELQRRKDALKVAADHAEAAIAAVQKAASESK